MSPNRWHPRRLPRMRDDLTEALVSAVAELGDHFDADLRDGLLREAAHLRVAEMFWATSDMTRLALTASGSLPEWTPAATRPANFGLLLWESSLPHLAWRGAPDLAWTRNALGARVPPTVPVAGVAWAPDPAGIAINLLTRTDEIPDAWLTPRNRRPDLFTFGTVLLSLWEPVPTTSADFSSGLVAALGATWLLMSQPGVADSRPLDASSAATRPGMAPDPGVRIIDLRRAQPPSRPDTTPGADARVYHHRWLVRGHWRQQAVGPARSQRRPTWVSDYLKGPLDAPLLDTDYVHVWRR